MPLPQFLLMLFLVILAAGATVWALSSTGLPLAALAITALLAAAGLRLASKER